MPILDGLKSWVKARDTRTKCFLYCFLKGVITLDVPPIRLVHVPLYILISGTSGFLFYLVRAFYWKPVFVSRLSNRPRRMNLDGRGMPQVIGPLKITMGNDCRVSAQVTLSGRTAGATQPELIIGNNVGLSWQTGIYIGRKVIIGNNVRIGGQGTLAGYPGHPIDAAARARGEPDADDQARDIVLEDDVWLARGVIVNAGVTIGRGTIVAAGSVVTRDLPAGVLAGGVPAKIIKEIDPAAGKEILATLGEVA